MANKVKNKSSKKVETKKTNVSSKKVETKKSTSTKKVATKKVEPTKKVVVKRMDENLPKTEVKDTPETITKTEVKPVVTPTTTVTTDKPEEVKKEEDQKSSVVSTKPVEQPAPTDGKKKKKKKKKKHVGLIIFLTLFSLLIVLPVGFVGIFILDYSTCPEGTIPEETLNVDTLKNEMILNSMKNTPETHEVSVDMDQNTFNGIFKTLIERIGQKDYLPKMYCIIEENTYKFYIEAKFNFLQTRICLETELATHEEEGVTDPYLEFKIKRIVLGKFPIPDGLINFALEKANITNERINSIIQGTGFQLEVDLAKRNIIYKKSKFMEDLAKLGVLSSESNFGNIIMHLLNSNLDIIDFDTTNKLSFSLKLENLHKSETAENKNHEEDISYKNLKNDVLIVAKDNPTIFYPESNNGKLAKDPVEKLFKFFLKGYEYYNNNQGKDGVYEFISKNNINISNSEIGKAAGGDYTKVKGLLGLEGTIKEIDKIGKLDFTQETITELINDITAGKECSSEIMSINESTLNGFFKNIDIVGLTTLFAGTINNEEIINNITFEDFNFNINENNDGKIDMFFSVSINGYCVTLHSSVELIEEVPNVEYFNSGETQTFTIPKIKLEFDTESMELGHINLKSINPNLPSDFTTLISKNFTSSKESKFSIFEEGGKLYMEFNISNVLENALSGETGKKELLNNLYKAAQLKEKTPSLNIKTEKDRLSVVLSVK